MEDINPNQYQNLNENQNQIENQSQNQQQSNESNQNTTKKIDYFKVVSKAFKMVWQNKFLWILGFFVALGSFSLNNNNSGNFDDLSAIGENPYVEEATTFFNDYTIPVILIAAVLFIIIIAIIIIGIFAKGGLIHAIDKIDRGDKTDFKQSFKFGISKFWLFVKGGLTMLLAMLPILLIIFLVIFFSAAGAGAEVFSAGSAIGFSIIVIIIFLIFFPFILILSIIIDFAIYFNIIHQIPYMEGLKKGYRFFIRNFKKLFISWLVILLIQIGVAIGLLIIFIMPALMLFFLGFGVWMSTGNITTTFLTAIGLFSIYAILTSIISGFFVAVYQAYWIMIFNRLVYINQIENKTNNNHIQV